MSDNPRRLFRYQRTVLQALDANRFLTEQHELPTTMGAVRSELFLAFVLGHEAIVPAGHIAESRSLIAAFSEIMEALPPRARPLLKTERWRPFRVALDSRYKTYRDYVENYRDVGAEFVVLNEKRTRPAEGTVERLKLLEKAKRHFLARDYKSLDKTVAEGFGLYASLVDEFLDATATTQAPAEADGEMGFDYSGHLATLANRVAGEGERDIAKDIREAVAQVLAKEGQFEQRGPWYAYRTEFGEHWPIVRHWLDCAFYAELVRRYESENAAFLSQDIPGAQAALHVLFPQRDAVNIRASAEPSARSTRIPPPLDLGLDARIDWRVLWDMALDQKFLRMRRDLVRTINDPDADDLEVHDRLSEHLELVQQYFSHLRYDLRSGKVWFIGDQSESLLKRLILPALIGAGVGTALGVGLGVPLLLGTQLGAALTAGIAGSTVEAVAGGIFGTLGAGALSRLVETETRYFANQRRAALDRRNKQVLEGAETAVNFWAKFTPSPKGRPLPERR